MYIIPVRPDVYPMILSNNPLQFSLARNRASLTARCRWGIKHALFHVAKEAASASSTADLHTTTTLSLIHI